LRSVQASTREAALIDEARGFVFNSDEKLLSLDSRRDAHSSRPRKKATSLTEQKIDYVNGML